MAKIDVRDPAALERFYDRDAFERDLARNSLPNASVLHGLKIASGPDPSGVCEITVASQQTGERDPEGDTLFLAPFASDTPSDEAVPDRSAHYARFIEQVRATAEKAEFKRPLGRDERLRGFHGG